MKLDAKKVVEIRERYDWLREIDMGTESFERLSPHGRDQIVAKEFGISALWVGKIVMGLAHPDAGGPIDNGRRARHDLFRRETAVLGKTEAKRRLGLRAHGIDPDKSGQGYTEVALGGTMPELKTVQRVTIYDAAGKPTPATLDLEPGQTVRVELALVEAGE